MRLMERSETLWVMIVLCVELIILGLDIHRDLGEGGRRRVLVDLKFRS